MYNVSKHIHMQSKYNVSREPKLLPSRGHEDAKGKPHKDPRKETLNHAPFEDQEDTSLPEFCKAVRNVNIRKREYSGKESTTNNDRGTTHLRRHFLQMQ
jgi:hypothetical protein